MTEHDSKHKTRIFLCAENELFLVLMKQKSYFLSNCNFPMKYNEIFYISHRNGSVFLFTSSHQLLWYSIRWDVYIVHSIETEFYMRIHNINRLFVWLFRPSIDIVWRAIVQTPDHCASTRMTFDLSAESRIVVFDSETK